MVTGELRNQVDQVWDAFWSGGISNPLEIIEQITYLLFLRRLDDVQTLEENKSARLKQPIEHRIFPAGNDKSGMPYDNYRWSRFKNLEAREMYTVIGEHVFPFLRTLGGEGSNYAKHMKDARFTIPSPALLVKVVDLLDKVPMEDRDTKGDIYEYMLSKIATAGQNGQFRTPRHIIKLMVEMVAPQPKDIACDPASGTCGFLVAVGEYLREHHPETFSDAGLREHFHHDLFHGFDFDNTMLRIGSMNMLLHGVENPDIRYRDSLSQDHAGGEERYTLVMANPPFAGSLDYENTAKDLQQIVKTKKTELLFLALFLRLLKPGGRAAVIVPEGVLFGSSNAHKTLRKILIEEQKLDAVISLPSGVFKPYSGVSTAILLFTKTNSGGTDQVWFYDCDADGWSLDDKRAPLLSEEKLGCTPKISLSAEEHDKNNLADILVRWPERNDKERERPHTKQSFCVLKAELVAQDYDLSLNRYKEVIHKVVEHRAPREILADLARLEREIQEGMNELEGDAEVNVPRVRVGDLAEQIRGVTYRKEDAETSPRPGYLPVLRAGNITDEGLVFNDLVFVPAKRISRKQKVRHNDVLVAASSGSLDVVGKTAPALTDYAGGFGAFCKVLRPNEKVNPAYFAQFFKTPEYRRRISVLASGANINNLRNEHLDDIEIPLPPLLEQRRIADILDRVEALGAKRRAALAQLDTLTQAIFLDMFGDPVTNTRGWPNKKLVDVGSLDRGVSKHRPRNAPELIGGPYPLVQTGDVANCEGYIRTYNSTYSDIGLQQSKMWPSGTLCITIAANIAKTGILTFDACFPDSVVGFHSIDPSTIEYVRIWLSFLQKRLEETAPESAQKNINLAILRELDIPFPPLAFQHEFAHRIAATEKLKTAHRVSLVKMDELFASLQYRAFQGEL